MAAEALPAPITMVRLLGGGGRCRGTLRGRGGDGGPEHLSQQGAGIRGHGIGSVVKRTRASDRLATACRHSGESPVEISRAPVLFGFLADLEVRAGFGNLN